MWEDALHLTSLCDVQQTSACHCGTHYLGPQGMKGARGILDGCSLRRNAFSCCHMRHRWEVTCSQLAPCNRTLVFKPRRITFLTISFVQVACFSSNGCSQSSRFKTSGRANSHPINKNYRSLCYLLSFDGVSGLLKCYIASFDWHKGLIYSPRN